MDLEKQATLMSLRKTGGLPEDLRNKVKSIRITSMEIGYYFVFNKAMTEVELYHPHEFDKLENNLSDVGGWVQVDAWDINY